MVIVILTWTAELSWARHICPSDKASNHPCECTSKKDGVVLVCDRTKLHDVGESMKFFRENGGMVINYLTIRQTDAPRLPNGFFMGKEHPFFCRANLVSYNVFPLWKLSRKENQFWIIMFHTQQLRTYVSQLAPQTRHLYVHTPLIQGNSFHQILRNRATNFYYLLWPSYDFLFVYLFCN